MKTQIHLFKTEEFQDGDNSELNQVWGISNCRVLCDCTVHMFTKLALLDIYIAGEKVIREGLIQCCSRIQFSVESH